VLRAQKTLHHTQSSLCSAQRWTMSVIDRRRSSVSCWTTLSDYRRAVAKLFLIQRLEKSSRGITLIFGDIQISYLFEKYFPASGGFVP